MMILLKLVNKGKKYPEKFFLDIKSIPASFRYLSFTNLNGAF